MTGALAFSPDSSLLAVALMKDTIQVWNLREIRGALAAEGLDWR